MFRTNPSDQIIYYFDAPLCSFPSCEKGASQHCGACRKDFGGLLLAMYCSKKCQRSDWPRHKLAHRAKKKNYSKCWSCTKETTKRCHKCALALFCTLECEKAYQSAHEDDCLFLQRNEEVNRETFLLNKDNFEQLEQIDEYTKLLKIDTISSVEHIKILKTFISHMKYLLKKKSFT